MDTPIYVQTQSDLDRLAAAAFADLRTERRHGAEHLHVATPATDRSRIWRELAWIAGVAVALALVVYLAIWLPV